MLLPLLYDGQPKVLNLKRYCYYLEHQKDVIVRQLLTYKRKPGSYRRRVKIALDHIDAVGYHQRIENVDLARTRLMEKFNLSEKQAQAIRKCVSCFNRFKREKLRRIPNH